MRAKITFETHNFDLTVIKKPHFLHQKMRFCLFSVFDLSAFMIQMVFVPVDQFRNGNNRIALVFQLHDQRIQRLSRKFCPVVAKNNRAVSQMLMLRHGLDDGIHSIIFPVKRIITCNRSKDFLLFFFKK